MKASLLKRYFDDNWFLNHVFTAAFREREEWLASDLIHLAAWVLIETKAPPCRGTAEHVKSWIMSRWALTEIRDGKLFVRPGVTHEGKDIRTLGDIPKAVTDLIKPGIQHLNRMNWALAQMDADGSQGNDQQGVKG